MIRTDINMAWKLTRSSSSEVPLYLSGLDLLPLDLLKMGPTSEGDVRGY